jgi:hypothetical protein
VGNRRLYEGHLTTGLDRPLLFLAWRVQSHRVNFVSFLRLQASPTVVTTVTERGVNVTTDGRQKIPVQRLILLLTQR